MVEPSTAAVVAVGIVIATKALEAAEVETSPKLIEILEEIKVSLKSQQPLIHIEH